MARDPASGVIRAFGWLMAIVFLASGCISAWALWELWRLVRAVLEG